MDGLETGEECCVLPFLNHEEREHIGNILQAAGPTRRGELARLISVSLAKDAQRKGLNVQSDADGALVVVYNEPTTQPEAVR